jgi:hypothetical protein
MEGLHGEVVSRQGAVGSERRQWGGKGGRGRGEGNLRDMPLWQCSRQRPPLALQSSMNRKALSKLPMMLSSVASRMGKWRVEP